MSKTAIRAKIITPSAEVSAERQFEQDKIAAQQFAKRLEYRRGGVLELELCSNAVVKIPIASISELAHATPAQLKGLKLSPTGGAIALRELDVDISIPGLLRDLLGFGEVQQRRAARVKTPAKAAAARANGKLGGRPRKKPIELEV